MGTPDLRGTMGTFTLFTDDPAEITRSVSGGEIVKVPPVNGRVALRLEGPPNPLRRGHPYASVELTVDVDPEAAVARLEVGDAEAVVRQGEWSDWLPADFPLLGWLAKARGMFRVYARQLHPTFEMYVSPVNLDPRRPDLPISAPAGFSRELAEAIGPFYTQGIAEDTSALRQGALDLNEFETQSALVLDDELRELDYSLRRFRGGFLFFYFSSIDQNSHMLWGKYQPELLAVYRRLDAAAGEVMATARARGADLLVMSDHGFTSFDWAVNLNTWLWKHGFLTLKGAPSSEELFANVDWARTRLYAMGLNGLYLNLEGREKYGIVKRGAQSEAILRQVSEALTGYRDPSSGRQVVETVERVRASGGNAQAAPDLIVGYAAGYRGSWETALGATPGNEIDDNTDAWIGDHCINAADVPGVLFSNRKLRLAHPELKDVTVSILERFGTRPDPGMTGRGVF